MAQRLDKKHYSNMPPFTTYITRVIFMNTLAYNQRLKGVGIQNLRYSMLWPGMEIGYVDEALGRFRDRSMYLDDNPQKPTQFQAAANLTQAIRQEEQRLDDSDLRSEIDRRMGMMFRKGEFDLYLFPGGHEDVPDDRDAPKLVIPKYDAVGTDNPESAPSMVEDIFRHKGIGEGIRMYRNNLVFLIAFEGGVGVMYDAARHHLAMAKLAAPGSMAGFADYQQEIIRKKQGAADGGLDDAILKCHKYAYYPAAGNRLDYLTMDWKKGGGQRGLVDKFRDEQEIRTDRDQPDLPESLVDRIPKLKRDGEITTRDFRDEFYRDTALPMLIGADVFILGVRMGIERGVFVYKKGELVCGKGDPDCEIAIDDDSMVYTAKRAGNLGIWPRKPSGGEDDDDDNPPPPPPPPPPQFTATGKPSQAVKSVLDDLRKHDIDSISKMRIESKDNVFPLLTTVGRIREIEVKLKIIGDYETTAGGSFDFEFNGLLNDSEPVVEFLKPQLRNVKVGNMDVTLDIGFKGGMRVDWLEELAERLKLVENDITVSEIVGASG